MASTGGGARGGAPDVRPMEACMDGGDFDEALRLFFLTASSIVGQGPRGQAALQPVRTRLWEHYSDQWFSQGPAPPTASAQRAINPRRQQHSSSNGGSPPAGGAGEGEEEEGPPLPWTIPLAASLALGTREDVTEVFVRKKIKVCYHLGSV
jgi:hypothetical protein